MISAPGCYASYVVEDNMCAALAEGDLSAAVLYAPAASAESLRAEGGSIGGAR